MAKYSGDPGQINIKAVIGENKILPCRAENGSIRLVEWNRTDIKEGNVLRYRNDAVDKGDQHPSFKDRVVFQDREMKDGDVSLVLINVKMNDAGTYEAEVDYDGTHDEKKLCSIHLDVAPPPPPDQINIKAAIGENLILPCRAENGSIRFVEWKRADIEEENVLRYRGQVDAGKQHQSFKDRVVFQDREMKDGDVSLVLINVTMNDAGTYEAEVDYEGTNREKKLCSIHLDVAPPPSPPPPSVTAMQVRGQLRRLKQRKASGPGLPPRLLRTCAHELCQVLSYMYNLSLSLGVVPTLWKTSCVVPVPKTPHAMDPAHFRAVTLTSHLMKTMECLVLAHLRTVVSPTLDPQQFAYRPNIAVADAIIYLLQRALTWRPLGAL
ncbi:uncharacterized protein si:dkey-22i16.9 [Cyprinodon tularosa]|uniref:uncharacterized protein si:dkey-22i16.9 n=1 Tax=Cyprinodon tularosa TaxID=77115 RepID=UPI0018E246EC|nr:uncharacterized protein si:dkey-22i16.9 [Cyprinodon tularosa]